MKLSILRGGGREQALGWTAKKVGHEVYVDPGDAAIQRLRRGRAVPALRWAASR